jgi:hypothetical protein
MGPKRSSRIMVMPDRAMRAKRPRAKNSSHAGQPTIRSRRKGRRSGLPSRLRTQLPLLRPLLPLRRSQHHLCRRQPYRRRIPRSRRRSTRSSSAPTGLSKPLSRPWLPPTVRRTPGHPRQSRVPQWRVRSPGLIEHLTAAGLLIHRDAHLVRPARALELNTI